MKTVDWTAIKALFLRSSSSHSLLRFVEVRCCSAARAHRTETRPNETLSRVESTAYNKKHTPRGESDSVPGSLLVGAHERTATGIRAVLLLRGAWVGDVSRELGEDRIGSAHVLADAGAFAAAATAAFVSPLNFVPSSASAAAAALVAAPELNWEEDRKKRRRPVIF